MGRRTEALIRVAAVVFVGWLASGCAVDRTYTTDEFARVDKIDAHVHLHGAVPIFMARAHADGFRLLTINVNYADFPPLDQQLDTALGLRRAYPGRIEFATTFDAAGSEHNEWLEPTLQRLRLALDQGAIGVKVWKDIGMQQRDADGNVVMIDDARFRPIFSFLRRRNVVLLGHQGEPRNAWLPLAEMTIRGDREYFTNHPQYHMFAHSEWPAYEEQLAARDRLLDQYRKVRFVGVHLASLEWDIDRIAEFLRRYPRATVDLAARLVHVKLQASKDRDKVRQFFSEFQDRILYATDLSAGPEEVDAASADAAHATWFEDWRFLCCDVELSSPDFDGSFRGLALQRAIIDKIYNKNARRLFPRAWRER